MEVTLQYKDGVFVPETPIHSVEGQRVYVNIRTKEETEESLRLLQETAAKFPKVDLPDDWEFRREDIYD